jgi:hypothetical protein
MNDASLSGLTAACRPTLSEARRWAAALQFGIPSTALNAYGINANLLQSLRAGRKVKLGPLRWLWFVWSLHHCPSNLSDAFTVCTWGRFNPAMPQDFRAQALRLLNRKSGPRGSKLGGRAWVSAKAAKVMRCYLLPGSGLPALL